MLTVAQRRHNDAHRDRMPRAWRQGDEPVPGTRLVQFLGRGGAGEVWHAHAPTGLDIALKIIRCDDQPATPNLRLLDRITRIRHPNLAPCLPMWVRDQEGVVTSYQSREPKLAAPPEVLFLALSLAEQNVLDRLKECQREDQAGIPRLELLGYLEDAARALDYLHSPKHELGHGPVAVTHGDIKPQNLLLVGGAVQLSDTGLAAALGGEHTAHVPGTAPAFVAPEVLEGCEPKPFADQYSLAITYYLLRTGSLPFSTNDPATISTEACEGRLDLSLLAAAEQQVIRRATSRRPEARYPNCLDFTRELRRAAEQSTPAYEGLVIEPNREIVPGHKLVRLLGRGAYGEVWEALAPGRLAVALKIIKDLDRASGRGKQEFRALELIKNIHHTGLMELRAFWLLDRHGQTIPDDVRGHTGAPVPATLVIATRLADKTLSQVLDQYREAGRSGIPPHELLTYFGQVAAALDFLNTARHPLSSRRVAIQHRDVKPDNIMLAGDVIKLTDFGLAKVMDSEHLPAEIRQDSVGFTFHYAAPEVLRGKVTRWSDQYSLAISYYELRTGQLPYGPGASAYQQMMQQLEGRLDLGQLPDNERQILIRATSVVPEERFPTCAAFVEALSRIDAFGEIGAVDHANCEKEGSSRPPAIAMPPRAPHTMAVVLHRGEVYPAPIEQEPDWGYLPLAADTDPEAVTHTAPISPAIPEPEEKVDLPVNWLPLAMVFVIGIGLAMVVHSTFKRDRRTMPPQAAATRPATPPVAVAPARPQTVALDKVVSSKPASTPAAEKPSALPSLPPPQPPEILPVAAPAPPVVVLGKNVRDPDFQAYLDSSVSAIIASAFQPADFDQALRDLDPLPPRFTTPRLLAFRAECHLEGSSKNLTRADELLKQAATLGEPTAYVQYVQARLHHERKQPVQAVLLLEEALRRDLSLTGFRRDRAQAIVTDATKALAQAKPAEPPELRRVVNAIQNRLR